VWEIKNKDFRYKKTPNHHTTKKKTVGSSGGSGSSTGGSGLPSYSAVQAATAASQRSSNPGGGLTQAAYDALTSPSYIQATGGGLTAQQQIWVAEGKNAYTGQ
jgi:hypothetical protein